MKSEAIRKAFLDFFAEKGHEVVPSAPLIPQHDPTLYFVNAGMVPFKDYFTGAAKAPYARATSSQLCMRVSGKHNDLDNVGRTPRHHTLFEMLGNFSFGDYFKADAIPFAWELLTERLGIDGDRLWVTVYVDDDEAFEIWRDGVGVPEARIQRLTDDNFWSMGALGPCGPSSEIFFDHGKAIDDNDGGPATESDRYVEIWNLVFMQFEQVDEATRIDLPKPSIDTGSGLERVAAVLQGKYWNYDTDLFTPLIAKGEALAKVAYGANPETDVALRVIADHARMATFLASNGVVPGNAKREYVMRRVLRRGVRFGYKLGLEAPFLHEVCSEVIERMAGAYPELAQRADVIRNVVHREEETFFRTLSNGIRLLDGELKGAAQISGKTAFTLYATHGFPLDLTEQIAAEHLLTVDIDAYNRELELHKLASQGAGEGWADAALDQVWHDIHDAKGSTTFTGHTETSGTGEVVALVRSDEDGTRQVEQLNPGETGIVVLNETPFYAEGGGQVGDAGTLSSFEVTDTTKAAELHLHHGTATSRIQVGDEVGAEVDVARRNRTQRNHTGTHLLHAALRAVLGEHVTQKGSLVAPDRLRFDFTHPAPMTDEERERVERLVNEEILANKPLGTSLEDLEQAKAQGAMALFGEKYADRVRVVTVPGFSVELCGGTHCTRTGDIGLFTLVSESGVAGGVRRIEAQTGTGALRVISQDRQRLQETAQALKTDPTQVADAVVRLQQERKTLERRIAEMEREAAKAAAGDLIGQAREVGPLKVLAAQFDGDLGEQADRLRDQLGSSLVVLFAADGDKVKLVSAATKDVAGKTIHAGKVLQEVAPLVGGRGGGRPDLARGGGTDPSGISAAIERVYAFVEEQLS
ncbi:MAG: alanine--tRNA ligase [Myxococcota bacterium]